MDYDVAWSLWAPFAVFRLWLVRGEGRQPQTSRIQRVPNLGTYTIYPIRSQYRVWTIYILLGVQIRPYDAVVDDDGDDDDDDGTYMYTYLYVYVTLFNDPTYTIPVVLLGFWYRRLFTGAISLALKERPRPGARKCPR